MMSRLNPLAPEFIPSSNTSTSRTSDSNISQPSNYVINDNPASFYPIGLQSTFQSPQLQHNYYYNSQCMSFNVHNRYHNNNQMLTDHYGCDLRNNIQQVKKYPLLLAKAVELG